MTKRDAKTGRFTATKKQAAKAPAKKTTKKVATKKVAAKAPTKKPAAKKTCKCAKKSAK